LVSSRSESGAVYTYLNSVSSALSQPRPPSRRSQSPRFARTSRPGLDTSGPIHSDPSLIDFFADHTGSSRQAVPLSRPDDFARPDHPGSRHLISPAGPSNLTSREPAAPPPNSSSSPFDNAMTETLERQPRLASGYEWDERHHSLSQGQDGTACLSVEPDGDGYLGGWTKSKHR
jgi:hypothetical protein